MTAEIAVLNKFGVALAADSAITVEVFHDRRIKRKVHNSANKLFTLSKHHPIGVMFYNTVTISGVPWETVFKLYRKNLGNRPFDTVSEYVEDFFGWLGQKDVFFAANQEKFFVENALLRKFVYIDPHSRLKAAEMRAAIDERISELENLEAVEGFDKTFCKNIKKEYDPIILRAAEVAFKGAFWSNNKTRIRQLAILALSRKEKLSSYSGLVFAGFGDRESLPRLEEHYCDLMVLNRPRRWHNQTVFVDGENSSEVVPLADSGVIETLVKGISPGFEDEAYTQVLKLLLSLPEKILEPVSQLTDDERKNYVNKAKSALPAQFRDFNKSLVEYRLQNYTVPIKQAIGSLPVSELALVAESFLGASQVLKKVNPDLETVGGPVDVAVISKGDGFVWIKRKHYFSEEFNPSFKARYLTDGLIPSSRVQPDGSGA